MGFEASEYSRESTSDLGDLTAWHPARWIYDWATGSNETAVVPANGGSPASGTAPVPAAPKTPIQVKDWSGWVFEVRPDGTILRVSDPQGVPKPLTYAPGSPVYAQVLSNLADVPGNQAKIDAVVGSGTVAAAAATAPAQSGASLPPAQAAQLPAGPDKRPIYFQWWFWPSAMVVTAAVVGGGYYAYTRTKVKD